MFVILFYFNIFLRCHFTHGVIKLVKQNTNKYLYNYIIQYILIKYSRICLGRFPKDQLKIAS